MATLHAYDLEHRLIADVTSTVWQVWSALTDILAARFETYAGLIHADEGDDGVEYLDINGKRVGYVLSVLNGREVGERPAPAMLEAAE